MYGPGGNTEWFPVTATVTLPPPCDMIGRSTTRWSPSTRWVTDGVRTSRTLVIVPPLVPTVIGLPMVIDARAEHLVDIGAVDGEHTAVGQGHATRVPTPLVQLAGRDAAEGFLAARDRHGVDAGGVGRQPASRRGAEYSAGGDERRAVVG